MPDTHFSTLHCQDLGIFRTQHHAIAGVSKRSATIYLILSLNFTQSQGVWRRCTRSLASIEGRDCPLRGKFPLFLRGRKVADAPLARREPPPVVSLADAQRRNEAAPGDHHDRSSRLIAHASHVFSRSSHRFHQSQTFAAPVADAGDDGLGQGAGHGSFRRIARRKPGIRPSIKRRPDTVSLPSPRASLSSPRASLW